MVANAMRGPFSMLSDDPGIGLHIDVAVMSPFQVANAGFRGDGWGIASQKITAPGSIFGSERGFSEGP
jgi:hypothetical protein